MGQRGHWDAQGNGGRWGRFLGGKGTVKNYYLGLRGDHVWGKHEVWGMRCPMVPSIAHRAAKGPAPHLKRTGSTATVKAMLLEWCRARTRSYQVRIRVGPCCGAAAGQLGSRLTPVPPAACGGAELRGELGQRLGLLCPDPQLLP